MSNDTVALICRDIYLRQLARLRDEESQGLPHTGGLTAGEIQAKLSILEEISGLAETRNRAPEVLPAPLGQEELKTLLDLEEESTLQVQEEPGGSEATPVSPLLLSITESINLRLLLLCVILYLVRDILRTLLP